MRVPVVSKDGEPLMPTTSARARKMIEDGVAEKKWTDTDEFYIRVTFSALKDGAWKDRIPTKR